MVEIASGRLAVLFGASALISAALLWVLHPLLKRYALARPNARSSHPRRRRRAAASPWSRRRSWSPPALSLSDARAASTSLCASPSFSPRAVALAGVGAIDDIRPLGIWPRLLLQAIAVIVVLAALPVGCASRRGCRCGWSARSFSSAGSGS